MSESITAKPDVLGRDDEAWHRFLALLAPDRAGAATRYRDLRRRLVDLFRWRGLAGADDLADETLERAVRSVATGEEIRSMTGYVSGIANRLALEAARRDAKVVPLSEQADRHTTDEDGRQRLDSLEQCLERLPSQTRAMLLRYYAVGPERVGDRRKIADELGIGLNALRIRIHRLRATLESCLGRAEAS